MALKDTSIKNDFTAFDFPISGLVKSDFLKKLFKQNNLRFRKEVKQMQQGLLVSKLLQSEFNASFTVENDEMTCKNVVAMLPGSDPVLKNEYVVIGGHLDHVGITKPVKGDSICNGMWDNASGSAAIVAIAKAFTKLPEKPKRSIVFVLFTGEEKGLLGSAYFAKNTKIPNGKMVACLNIDMLGALFEVKDIIPLGYTHSNLSEAVNFAGKELNIIVDNNKEEEENYIQRSDQMSFLKNGIPALNVGMGYTAVNPKINAQKEVEKWMKKTYHQPSDDLNQSYDEKAFLQSMQVQYLTAYYIANHMESVNWNTDSWIYKKYVRKEK